MIITDIDKNYNGDSPKDWQRILSEKYYHKTIVGQYPNYPNLVFEPGKLYVPNILYLKASFIDILFLESYESTIHNKNLSADDDGISSSRLFPPITIKLIPVYSSFKRYNRMNGLINNKDILFCLGSSLGWSGTLSLYDTENLDNKIIKPFDRVWYTRFLYQEKIAVYRWNENPDILDEYHKIRDVSRPYPLQRSYYDNHRCLKEYSNMP